MKTAPLHALTGLRGLAAWLVVLYHFRELAPGGAGPLGDLLDHGFLAVDLFFILSGLVLYLNYHAHFERLQPASVLDFYGRRLARIYPLHLVILLLFLLNPLAITLFSASGDPGPRYEPGYFVLSLFLVQNWGFTPWVAWNIPAWSISTEFAAYLLFPLLVWFIKRLSLEQAWRWGVAYALLLCLLAALYHLSGTASVGLAVSQLGLPRCVLEFTMGLLLGHALVNRGSALRGAALPAGLGGLALLAAVVAFGPVPDYAYAPLLFSLLIVALLDPGRAVSRALARPLFIHLGEISYSTYLIHFFIKDWVKFLASDIGPGQFFLYVIAVYAASVLLYRTVEVPARVHLYRWLDADRSRRRFAE